MAFLPRAVQESFTVITLSQVWGGIEFNLIDLGTQKCAPPLLCGAGDGFSTFHFIFRLISQMAHTELHPKKG